MEKKNLAAEAAAVYNQKVFKTFFETSMNFVSTLPKTEELTVTIRPKRIVNLLSGIGAVIASHISNREQLEKGQDIPENPTIDEIGTWVKTHVAPVFVDGVVTIYKALLETFVDDVNKPLPEMFLTGEKFSGFVTIDDHVVVK